MPKLTLPKLQSEIQSKPKPKPQIVVTPKYNIVEQAPFIGFMLDELIRAQAMAFIPVVESLEQIRQQMLPPHQGGASAIPLIEKLEQVRQEIAQVKKEIQDRRDEGEYKYIEDTATTTGTTWDFTRLYGHPIKGFILTNDGSNNIQVGYMSLIGLPTEIAEERMGTVMPKETFDPKSNVKTIKTMKIITSSGTSVYRMWLLW